MRLLITILVILSGQMFSQNINKKIFDKNLNDSLLVGVCNTEGFNPHYSSA